MGAPRLYHCYLRIDRGLVTNFGSLLAEGTPEGIKNDPRVQEAYLGGEMS